MEYHQSGSFTDPNFRLHKPKGPDTQIFRTADETCTNFSSVEWEFHTTDWPTQISPDFPFFCIYTKHIFTRSIFLIFWFFFNYFYEWCMNTGAPCLPRFLLDQLCEMKIPCGAINFCNRSAQSSHDWFAPRRESRSARRSTLKKCHTTNEIIQSIVGWGWNLP